MRDKIKQKLEDGFTLVEMAMVLIVAGLMIYFIVASYYKWDGMMRAQKTRVNMDIITDALAAYVARNYRIPCPADPSNNTGATEPIGAEFGSGADGADMGECDGLRGAGLPKEDRGIVPYFSLGINSEDARDGWGNYITYRVDSDYTRDPEEDDADDQVHAACRTLDWIEGTTIMRHNSHYWHDGGRNVNAQKARFCCKRSSGAASRIKVYTEYGTPNIALQFEPDEEHLYERADVLADPLDNNWREENNGNNPKDGKDPISYDPNDTGATKDDRLASKLNYSPVIYGGGIEGFEGPVSGHTDTVIYALVSHGENEAGAFIVKDVSEIGSFDKLAVGLSGTPEKINFTLGNDPTNENKIMDIEINRGNGPATHWDPANYFDDIVVWGTQSSLLARLRRDSCRVP